MTVSELIQQLQLLPQDITVVVPGYEGGYDDVSIGDILYLYEMKYRYDDVSIGDILYLYEMKYRQPYSGKYDNNHELVEGCFKAICL